MGGVLSNEEVQEMNRKLNDAINPETEYTYEDFYKEYGGEKHTIVPNENFNKIQINFVNKSDNKNPWYETVGSSGFDLRANLDSPMTLKSGEYAMVPTGLFFEIPENFEIQVRPRSGLAVKHGVTVLNSPGTVDSDYRGELKVVLINHGKDDFVIEHGDRIAQGVISTVTAKNIINLVSVNSINDDTERGTGGFGSTGTK